MSIRQLQYAVDELKEEAKEKPERETEYRLAYKVLEDKIRERDKYKTKCVPSRLEHELDIKEEFQLE